MVFWAFPSIPALAIVLSIWSLYRISCWGRRIASDLRSALVILGVGWLEWFSIPAWGVGDPGFKSQRPHHNNLGAEGFEHSAEELMRKYTQDVNEIKKFVGWIKSDVETFNGTLESFVKQLVVQRKKKLLNAQGVVGALGIPIRQRDNLPLTYAVPGIQRKPEIARPKATTEAFKPEPTLPMEEYENILRIIQSMVLVMERSPRALADMREEDFRQHFLVQLNGHYEGQASGETLNYEGKTDILIRADNKSVFIAECKFWGGEIELLKTIDQLLRYTRWRDTKTAILLFNQQKDFSAVLGKIPGIVKSHSCYKRELEKKEETIFRYVFHQRDDSNRELILTIMVFNVPRQ